MFPLRPKFGIKSNVLCLYRFFLVVVLLLSPLGHLRADIYIYRAPDGVVHFTNTPTGNLPWRLYLREGTPKNRKPLAYEKLIEELSLRYGLDPSLVKAVVEVESNFDPLAVSPKGAMGLMQLMPSTARLFGVSNPFDPRENLEAGIRYLKNLLERFNYELHLALAAYNAGPELVSTMGNIPPFTETRQYVKKVLERYQQLKGRR